PARPRSGVIMPVDAACMTAAAARRRALLDGLSAGIAGVTPGRITAVGAHGRPVRHGRWRRTRIELGEGASAIDDPAAEQGEVGGDIGYLRFRAREVVAVGDNEIG